MFNFSLFLFRLPPGFFETSNQPSPKQTTKNASSVKLLAGDYDNDEEEEDNENVSAVPSSTQQSMEIPLPPPAAQDSGLPPGIGYQ